MRTTAIISVSLPPAMVRQFEEVRKRESRTRSELVREALRAYFEQRYPTVSPTTAELAALRRGRAAFRRGDSLSLNEFLNGLEAGNRRAGAKGVPKASRKRSALEPRSSPCRKTRSQAILSASKDNPLPGVDVQLPDHLRLVCRRTFDHRFRHPAPDLHHVLILIGLNRHGATHLSRQGRRLPQAKRLHQRAQPDGRHQRLGRPRRPQDAEVLSETQLRGKSTWSLAHQSLAHQWVANPERREARKVPVRSPKLSDRMLKAKRCDTSVVDLRPGRS